MLHVWSDDMPLIVEALNFGLNRRQRH